MTRTERVEIVRSTSPNGARNGWLVSTTDSAGIVTERWMALVSEAVGYVEQRMLDPLGKRYSPQYRKAMMP